jgi:hypothetical protein
MIWSHVQWDLDLTPSSKLSKLRTRPLVREGAVQEVNGKYLEIFSMDVREKLVEGPK